MTFREYLYQIINNGKEDELFYYLTDNLYTNALKTYDPGKIKSAYQAMIDSLLNIDSTCSQLDYIYCIKCLDFDTNDNYTEIEYYDTYSCCCKYKNDSGTNYSLFDVDWSQMIDAQIKPSCIARYGVIPVIANLLYEISWHGFDYESSKKNQKDFEESLVEAQKEISDESNDFYKSFDDLLEAVGISKKTKKEQQRIDKILDMISKKINENYKIELDAILPNE